MSEKCIKSRKKNNIIVDKIKRAHIFKTQIFNIRHNNKFYIIIFDVTVVSFVNVCISQ